MTETIENKKKKRKTNSSKNNQTKNNYKPKNNKNYQSKNKTQKKTSSTKKIVNKPNDKIEDVRQKNIIDETVFKSKEDKIQTIKQPSKSKAKNILGMDLPEGETKADKEARCKIYIKDAIVFSLIAPVIDLLGMLFLKKYNYVMITNNNMINYLFTILIDFIIIFIVTFCIDYIAGEKAVKKDVKGE